MVKIIIGSDHAGFEYKEDLIELLKKKINDLLIADRYPDAWN